MIEIKGKYTTAKIFSDDVESTAWDQIKTLCDMEYSKDSHIRIMPDVHAGAGCTIGTTMKIKDSAVPNLVGVDIGCGTETIMINTKKLRPEKLDGVIRSTIPSGFNIRGSFHPYAECIDLSKLKCRKEVDIDRAYKSIGTLGGGNHFIEANTDDDGNIYLVVHTGSRHIGLQTANLYQRAASNSLKGKNIPKQLAYVSGLLFKDYIYDMKIIQRYANLNRNTIMDELIERMKFDVKERFTTIHNYIDTDNMILRKGAVSAKTEEIFLIPINMRDGSLICEGKGNSDWNFSAPHGAGRLLSRKQAKKIFKLSEFKKTMEGIYTTSINKKTLDECPMAYKDMGEIEKNITPTATILKKIKPIYNFKAEN